jgi:hypothetical protein
MSTEVCPSKNIARFAHQALVSNAKEIPFWGMLPESLVPNANEVPSHDPREKEDYEYYNT